MLRHKMVELIIRSYMRHLLASPERIHAQHVDISFI